MSGVRDTRSSLWCGVFLGVGTMAAIDEIVFHQLLAWHHFYDRSTPLVGLISDGFLHAAELVALACGFVIAMRLCRAHKMAPQRSWAGGLLGAGGFQLFDGIVDHKLLRLHQIRYGVDNLLMYDLAWNLVGLLLIAAGILLFRRARQHINNGDCAVDHRDV